MLVWAPRQSVYRLIEATTLRRCPAGPLASLSARHSMTLSRRRDDYYCATNKVLANGYMSSVQPTHASKTGRLSDPSDLVHAVLMAVFCPDRLVLRGKHLQVRRTAYAPAVFNIQSKLTANLSKRSTDASKWPVYGRATSHVRAGLIKAAPFYLNGRPVYDDHLCRGQHANYSDDIGVIKAVEPVQHPNELAARQRHCDKRGVLKRFVYSASLLFIVAYDTVN